MKVYIKERDSIMLHSKSVQYFTNFFKSRVNNKMSKRKRKKEFDNTKLHQAFRDYYHVMQLEYEQRVSKLPLSGSKVITYQEGF